MREETVVTLARVGWVDVLAKVEGSVNIVVRNETSLPKVRRDSANGACVMS